MKKGFTQTLMMTAILVMAAQAMAMAPIIGDIPSPVVGDQETATPANTFVYPDAIDLTQYVTDETTATDIVWSYSTETPQIYKINGVEALDINVDDPTNPTGKIIAGPGAQDLDKDLSNAPTTHTQDSNPNTITIRNIALSPIPGTAGTAPAAGDNYAQEVTFYASDTDTFSMKTVKFYTAKGYDHMSFTGIKVADLSFFGDGTGTSTGVTFVNQFGAGITHSVTSKGVCLNVDGVTAASDDYAAFGGDMNVALVQNNAFRIRLTVNGTQTATNTVPVWDVTVANSSPTTGAGPTLFGGDFIMFDNAGTANASITLSGDADHTYDFWWAPPPVLNARWNDTTDTGHGGPYAPSNVDGNKMSVGFRILDFIHSHPGAALHADQSVGSLCMKRMSIDRFDMINTLQADPTPVWSQTSWVQAPASGAGPAGSANALQYSGSIAATFAGDSSGVTFKSSGNGTVSGGNSAGVTALIPGDNLGGAAQLGTPTDTAINQADNFPLPYVPQTLYKITYMLSAPTQTDEDNAMDAIFFATQTAAMDEIQQTFIDNGEWHHGMPAFLAPQPFVLFFYTNYGQVASNPSWWGIAPSALFDNDDGFHPPASLEHKNGAIKLSSITCEKIVGGMN